MTASAFETFVEFTQTLAAPAVLLSASTPSKVFQSNTRVLLSSSVERLESLQQQGCEVQPEASERHPYECNASGQEQECAAEPRDSTSGSVAASSDAAAGGESVAALAGAAASVHEILSSPKEDATLTVQIESAGEELEERSAVSESAAQVRKATVDDMPVAKRLKLEVNNPNGTATGSQLDRELSQHIEAAASSLEASAQGSFSLARAEDADHQETEESAAEAPAVEPHLDAQIQNADSHENASDQNVSTRQLGNNESPAATQPTLEQGHTEAAAGESFLHAKVPNAQSYESAVDENLHIGPLCDGQSDPGAKPTLEQGRNEVSSVSLCFDAQIQDAYSQESVNCTTSPRHVLSGQSAAGAQPTLNRGLTDASAAESCLHALENSVDQSRLVGQLGQFNVRDQPTLEQSRTEDSAPQSCPDAKHEKSDDASVLGSCLSARRQSMDFEKGTCMPLQTEFAGRLGTDQSKAKEQPYFEQADLEAPAPGSCVPARSQVKDSQATSAPVQDLNSCPRTAEDQQVRELSNFANSRQLMDSQRSPSVQEAPARSSSSSQSAAREQTICEQSSLQVHELSNFAFSRQPMDSQRSPSVQEATARSSSSSQSAAREQTICEQTICEQASLDPSASPDNTEQQSHESSCKVNSKEDVGGKADVCTRAQPNCFFENATVQDTATWRQGSMQAEQGEQPVQETTDPDISASGSQVPARTQVMDSCTSTSSQDAAEEDATLDRRSSQGSAGGSCSLSRTQLLNSQSQESTSGQGMPAGQPQVSTSGAEDRPHIAQSIWPARTETMEADRPDSFAPAQDNQAGNLLAQASESSPQAAAATLVEDVSLALDTFAPSNLQTAAAPTQVLESAESSAGQSSCQADVGHSPLTENFGAPVAATLLEENSLIQSMSEQPASAGETGAVASTETAQSEDSSFIQSLERALSAGTSSCVAQAEAVGSAGNCRAVPIATPSGNSNEGTAQRFAQQDTLQYDGDAEAFEQWNIVPISQVVGARRSQCTASESSGAGGVIRPGAGPQSRSDPGSATPAVAAHRAQSSQPPAESASSTRAGTLRRLRRKQPVQLQGSMGSASAVASQGSRVQPADGDVQLDIARSLQARAVGRTRTSQLRESMGHDLAPPEQGTQVLVHGDGWGGGHGKQSATVTEADSLTFTVVYQNGPRAWEETHVLRSFCTTLETQIDITHEAKRPRFRPSPVDT